MLISKVNNRLAWVADGAVLKIEGGQIIITGGNFGFNPSAWVADGYTATKNGTIWTVSKN